MHIKCGNFEALGGTYGMSQKVDSDTQDWRQNSEDLRSGASLISVPDLQISSDSYLSREKPI